MATRGRSRFQPRKGFGRTETPDVQGSLPDALLKSARKTGQLNLSNRALGEVPGKVWRINTDVPEEAKNASWDNKEDRWWDQVDLTKLILASNSLNEISEDIRLLQAITVLDLHDNNLTNLPDAIGELNGLLRLNVSHNKLAAIPPCIGKLRRLQNLHLQHNVIEELPAFIGNLYDLEELILSNNAIVSIPSSIGHLTHVNKLDLSHNMLAELPVQLSGMDGLRVLDCTHNQLIYIPKEIGNLASLEQVYLRHNRLPALPPLKNCKLLKELHLGNNNIKEVTAGHLEQIPQVSVLDLRDNKIAELPNEISMLEALERLDLTNNELSGLPYILGTLPNLKSIVLDGNPMKSIRRDIIMRGTNGLKKYLVSRMDEPEVSAAAAVKQRSHGASGIVGEQVDVDSHDVKKSRSLEYIGKKATEIPLDLWNAAGDTLLAKVNFSKNNLSNIPERLLNYEESLEELDMGFNRVQTLSPDISCFKRIVFLDLRNNGLTTLPNEMSALQTLREITLSFNRFTVLPSILYELPKLEVILASDNQIASIDAQGLRGLSRLATLNLQNNNMSNIPPELGLCTQLRSLLLEGNPTRQPRPAILAKGTLAVLEYLKGRIPT